MATYIYGLFEEGEEEPIDLVQLPKEDDAEAKTIFAYSYPEIVFSEEKECEIRVIQEIE